MRDITLHHDGHGLNESIEVTAMDEIGPGGAHHCYEFWSKDGPSLGFLFFQRGPRGEHGSTLGVTEAAVLAVLIDRLQDFQDGPYECAENEEVLYHLSEALVWVKNRARHRAARGVLGSNQK